MELNEFTDKDQSSLPLYDLVGCDWSNFLFTNSKGESDKAGLRFSGTVENYKSSWLFMHLARTWCRHQAISVYELEEACLCLLCYLPQEISFEISRFQRIRRETCYLLWEQCKPHKTLDPLRCWGEWREGVARAAQPSNVSGQERKRAMGPQGSGMAVSCLFHPLSQSLNLVPSEASLG